jgi:hypothetical protein
MEVGEISPSMRVDTKPSHKLEYNGHWILFSPSLTIEQFHACADAVVQTINDFGKEAEA